MSDVVVFSSQVEISAQIIYDLLIRKGVPARIYNRGNVSGGELPFSESQVKVSVPAIYVEQAGALISEASTEVEGEPWKCAQCGEESPANFEQCWQCSTDK